MTLKKKFVLALAKEHSIKGKENFLYRVEDWVVLGLEEGEPDRHTKLISISGFEENYKNFLEDFSKVFGIKPIPLDNESVYVEGEDFTMIVSKW